MRRATLEDMAVAPVGKFVAGDAYAHFCMTPTIWGVILWGRPDTTTARELGRSLVLELASPAVPHVSLVDATRIEGADPRAFRAAEWYMASFHAQLAAAVTRLAMVRPSGMGGAIVAGAYEVIPPPYPVEVFDGVREAIAWLQPGTDVEAFAAGVAAIHAEAAGVPDEVGALRALLETNLEHTFAIAAAAKKLGMSERTLQRKLADAGTTFKDEVSEARVRAAKRLLVETDAPLTEIALEVGCGSLQSFSALFRRRTGESPSAYRARIGR